MALVDVGDKSSQSSKLGSNPKDGRHLPREWDKLPMHPSVPKQNQVQHGTQTHWVQNS